MNMKVSDLSGPIDATALAAVVSRRWYEARSYYTPRRSLEATWRLQSSSAVLELCWSRRTSSPIPACPAPELNTTPDGMK